MPYFLLLFLPLFFLHPALPPYTTCTACPDLRSRPKTVMCGLSWTSSWALLIAAALDFQRLKLGQRLILGKSRKQQLISPIVLLSNRNLDTKHQELKLGMLAAVKNGWIDARQLSWISQPASLRRNMLTWSKPHQMWGNSRNPRISSLTAAETELDKGRHKKRRVFLLDIVQKGGGVQPKSKSFEVVLFSPIFSLFADLQISKFLPVQQEIWIGSIFAWLFSCLLFVRSFVRTQRISICHMTCLSSRTFLVPDQTRPDPTEMSSNLKCHQNKMSLESN